MTKRVLILTVLVALGSAGCGGGDGGGGGNDAGDHDAAQTKDGGPTDDADVQDDASMPIVDVPSGTALGDVDSAEASSLCHRLFGNLRDDLGAANAVDYACVHQALADVVDGNLAETESACDDAASTCRQSTLAAATAFYEDESGCDEAEAKQKATDAFAANTCKSFTVGQTWQCLDTWLANKKTAFLVYDCELADHIEDAASVDQSFSQAESANISSDCEDILDCLDGAYDLSNLIPTKGGIAND